MKHIFTLFLAWGLVIAGQAQVRTVKLDLPRLVFSNLHLSLEQPLTGRWTIGGSVNTQLPLQLDKGLAGNIVESLNKRWTVGNFTGGKVSGFDVSPEVRYYLGRKNVRIIDIPRGFYVSGFLRYSRYSWDLPFEWYDDEINHIVNVNSDIQMSALGLGVGVGHQWLIKKKYPLDVYFMGIGLSRAWGDATLDIVESPELDSERAHQIAQHMAGDVDVGIDDKAPLASWYGLEVEATRDQVKAKGHFPLPIVRIGVALGIPL